MAVVVLDPGPDPSVKKEIVCRQCGAKLQYTPRDVKSKTTKDIDGGSGTWEWIVCPQCNEDVTVRST